MKKCKSYGKILFNILKWAFCIASNRFLRGMVRSIVGTLFDVGLGRLSVEEFCQKVEKRDRRESSALAPPEGLSLVEVVYPEDIFLDNLEGNFNSLH